MRQWKEKRKKVLVPGRIILVYNDKSINKAQTWQKISFGKMGRAIFHHSHDSIIILRPKKILSLFSPLRKLPVWHFPPSSCRQHCCRCYLAAVLAFKYERRTRPKRAKVCHANDRGWIAWQKVKRNEGRGKWAICTRRDRNTGDW